MLRGRLLAILAVLCTVSVVLPASADARAFGSRTLKLGSRGADVRTLQLNLTKVGFRTTADGVFGRGTQRTVRSWEAAEGLKVNGRVTRRDAGLLRAQVAALTAPAPEREPEPADDLEAADGGTAGGAGPGGASYVKVETATLNPDGTATPPPSAPAAVKQVILAGNRIAKKPYKYGGGHGRWEDSGYDCSGSVSYALHGGGILDTSMPSGSFTSWGDPGPGTWITTYANGGHMYMVVAGLRFDTSAFKSGGSRWTTEMRDPSSFVARHPRGY